MRFGDNIPGYVYPTVDGSVELWTAEGQALPDRPRGLVTSDWPYRPDDPSPPPKNFRRIQRIQPHIGEVQHLEFTLNCQSLVSTSGRRFGEMRELKYAEGMPLGVMPVYDEGTTPTIVKTEVDSGKIQWQADLAAQPSAMALDQGSQSVNGLLSPARLAMALQNEELVVMSMQDGSSLKKFPLRFGKTIIHASTIGFGDGGSLLWTTGTRYTGNSDQTTVTSVTAWDVLRGQRVATAEVPGQVLAAKWNPYGTQLATVRHFDNLPPSGTQLPWSFHLWDVKIVYHNEVHVSPEVEAE